MRRTATNKKTALWSQPNDYSVASSLRSAVGPAQPRQPREAAIEIEGEAGKGFYRDVVLVGAGASGVGVAHALLRGGMSPSQVMIIDKGPSVGSSFRQWHKTTRFISPSWPGYPFGVQDLNAVVPDTAVNGRGQHPTGDEYASYLERMVNGSGLPCMFNAAVTSIERVKQGCFIIKTDGGVVIVAEFVVWCGGEWVSPRMLNTDSFPKDATVHYKHANVDELLHSRRGTDDQIVLVGGGEAGADLGVALANQGAKVLIVESSSDDNEDEQDLDPSRRLSPVTKERLSRAADNIELRSATKCIGAKREGDTVTVTLEAADQAITTVTTGANVVLCTGFDPSCNSILKDVFFWKNGSPEVTPAHDESTTTRNLFLAGPALSHTLSCAPGDDSEESTVEDDFDNNGEVAPSQGYVVSGAGGRGAACNGVYEKVGEHQGKPMFKLRGGNAIIYFQKKWKITVGGQPRGWFYSYPGSASDEPPLGRWTTQGYQNGDADPAPTVSRQSQADDDTQNIIFCFVYKYRARFAVVAGEIIKRFVVAQRLRQQNSADDAEESAFSAEELDEVLVRCKRMQRYYQSKGMMLTDLSCAQLACGMSGDDRPVYDYDPCKGCETDCLTC